MMSQIQVVNATFRFEDYKTFDDRVIYDIKEVLEKGSMDARL